VIHRRTVVAEAGRDFTVHHRASPKALKPGEQYFYRFFTCNESSPVGRFKTALPADSREPVRIGFFSCQNFAAGYYAALAGLAREPDLDLVVCLGDYIYEQTGQDEIADRRDRTGANRDSEVQTLPEYRDKYRLYHTDADLLRLRARYPLLAIWDDHESENDNAGDEPAPLPENQNTGTRRLSYLDRRQAAYRAFFEHMPRIQVRAEPHRIYGTVRLGRNADLLLLDERQYRDRQPCEGRTAQPCPASETEAPGRTLLGAAQKAWLKNELASSRAAWKIVGNQVMIMALDIPARSTINPDQWDGYAAERRELLEFAQARGIRDISFLTGDIHTFFAGNVTPSGREGVPAQDGTPAATEFVGGSVTSKGLEEQIPSEGPVSGPLTENGVRANNPHIVQANLSRRGYGVLEARPDELRVDFRAVQTTQQRTSPVDTLARFRVARGTPRVEQI
jgi:alkaline phosphatase D